MAYNPNLPLPTLVDAAEALEAVPDVHEREPLLQVSGTEFNFYCNSDGVIDIEGSFGYVRQASYEPGDTVIEPDTFYLGWINVTPERGLGTTALAWTLQLARERGFHVCRTDPVSDRMVGLIEKFVRMGEISERYYLKDVGSALKPAVPSGAFHSHPQLISGAEAIDFLQAKQREYDTLAAAGGDPADIFSAINCVFYI